MLDSAVSQRLKLSRLHSEVSWPDLDRLVVGIVGGKCLPSQISSEELPRRNIRQVSVVQLNEEEF